MNLFQRLFSPKENVNDQDVAEDQITHPHTAKDLTPEELRHLMRHGSITVDTPHEGKVTYIFI